MYDDGTLPSLLMLLLLIVLLLLHGKVSQMLFITGGISGLACAVAGMLICASTYEDGVSDFYTNTSQDFSILTGLSCGLVVSALVSVSVSLCAHKRKHTRSRHMDAHQETSFTVDVSSDKEQESELEWQKTLCIDNPLNPYRALYKEHLKVIGVQDETCLTTKHMSKLFKRAKIISGLCALVSFLVFLVVLPAYALSQTVLTEDQMKTWISLCQYWCLVATVFVVVMPPVQEGRQIWRQYRNNKERDADNAKQRLQKNSTVSV